MPVLLPLVGLAFATHVTTYEVNARWTNAPFSGMESVTVDPAVLVSKLQPLRGPFAPDVEHVENGAPKGERALVFTNPMSSWAELTLNGAPVGIIGPYGTMRLDGVRFGAYTVDLRAPTGFERSFAVKVVPGARAARPVAVSVGRERVDLSDNVYFDLDSASILPESFPLLDAVAQALGAHPEVLVVRVEGHTDAQGDAAYNQTLSEARAAAVRDYLVKAGVAAERLVAAGFGESKLLDPADTEAAHEKNRRVDLVVEKRQEEAPPPEPPKGRKKRGK